jgi:probable phosphoglycerate mutase
VDPDLRERAFGVFEGLTREECAARYPDEWALYQEDRRLTPPGAEPHHEVITRVARAVKRATAVASGQAALIVGHGGSLRVLLSHATGRPFPPMGNGALFRMVVAGERFVEVAEVES